MKAESTVKPAVPFELEIDGEVSTVKFYENIEKITITVEEEEVIKYEYDEYQIKVPSRENLSSSIEQNYDSWLQLAKEKESEPKPETDQEKILRLEKENRQLGVELSEREINEIILGREISNLEIQILEMKGALLND